MQRTLRDDFQADLERRFLLGVGPGLNAGPGDLVYTPPPGQEITVRVVKTRSWFGTIGPVCRAYLTGQVTQQEFFDRVGLLRATF